MRPRSLRHKVFMFVLALLVSGAGLVMFVTERDVTATLTTSEERAVDNVLHLLASDSVARWASLLGEKASTARQARQPLIRYVSLIASVLEIYAQQAQSGLMDPAQARLAALQWVRELDLGSQRLAVILNKDLQIMADSQQRYSGLSIANMTDLKGRRFSEISERELGTGDYSFVIYRDTGVTGTLEPELRYAIWNRFRHWDWTIAINDSAQVIVDQFEAQRASMEAAVAETLESIQLAGSGFVFIVDSDGREVTPIPEKHQGFLEQVDPEHDGHSLSGLLARNMASGENYRFVFRPQGAIEADWIIKTAFVKPLKWTIIAAVPARELALPATGLRDRLGLIFLAGLLAALMLAWVLAARITRPLQQLSLFARHLPERDLTQDEGLPEHISRLPRRYRDEVGDLAAAFIHMDVELRKNVASLLSETSRRERYESELSIARDIQLGLLPECVPPEIHGRVDLHATMIPAKEVGGDLYDYFMLPDGRLCFAIGDVSDKGVPAALFMAVTRTLLRACAEDATHPAQLMERINTRLALNNPNLMFVTLIIGMLELGTGELSWANAGHPPACLLRAGQPLQWMEGRSGPACGVQEGIVYQGFSTTLAPGDYLVSYTDGITEAMNANDHAFGDMRMKAALANAGPDVRRAEQYAQLLIKRVNAFVDGNEQSDDISILVLNRMAS